MLSSKNLTRCLVGAGVLLALIQATARCHSLSTEDGISYLDVADAYLRGDWQSAINGCWSPLYSWILAGALALIQPSPFWEFATLKAVNVLIFLFALVSFEFFLREFLRFYDREQADTGGEFSFRIPESAWRAAGYTLFLWTSLVWIRVDISTPDLCTSGLLYLATALQLRIFRSPGYGAYLCFGAVLGLGYLSKAAIFPLAFVFFVSIVPFSLRRLKRDAGRIVLSFVFFAAVAAPFIAALTWKKGRFTINDAGTMNYAWFVSPGMSTIPGTHWQGGPPGSGTPVHPTRMLREIPEVYEFAEPVGGTYPPWYDPSYWYEGLTFPLDLKRQVITLVRNSYFYFEKFLGILIFGYVVLVLANGSLLLSAAEIFKAWRFLLPPVCGLFLYALVMDLPASYFDLQPTTRYVGAFVLLLFATVFSTVRLRSGYMSLRLLQAMLAVAILLPSVPLVMRGLQDLQQMNWRENIEFQIAEGLHQEGIPQNARVAIVGKGHLHQSWARQAHVKIIAEVPDHREFWLSSRETRTEIEQLLMAGGVQAFVGTPFPIESLKDSGWKRIGSTRFLVFVPGKQDGTSN